MDVMDENQDGVISKTEFSTAKKKWHAHHEKHLTHTPKQADTNHEPTEQKYDAAEPRLLEEDGELLEFLDDILETYGN